MRKPIKSPVQIKADNPIFLVKLAADLLKVHNQLMPAIDSFSKGLSELKQQAERIKSLPKGDRGVMGPAGPQGRPGKDGADGRDGKDGEMPDITVIAQLAAAMLEKPKDGVAPTMEALLEVLKEELKNMETKDFPAISREMASYRNQLAGKVYGKDTWARGGGTTVSAGANITLTPLPDGTVQINASGGGSGTNVTTQYSLTAVQAGADVTIDLSQLTNFATYAGLVQVQRNNIPQTETINFTQTPTEVTIFSADAGEVFNIVYAYN